ncbi:mitochondrial dynamin GTPase Msp1 [Massospora cicadina]|nr:mitochondrial dynamin GTPase Msp1 [Massospora cicadina]
MITRPFSFTAVPRFLLRTLRVPAGMLGVGVGAITYFNNLVHEVANNLFPGWLRDAAQEAGGFFFKAKDGGSKLFDEANGFLTSFFGGAGGDYGPSDSPDATSLNNGSFELPTYAASEDQKQVEGSGEMKPLVRNQSGGTNFSPLIRKLIEVRAILKLVDNRHQMHLPSIVVIGSQSSGKSSVLEAIVGREFLPKGSNMVTRRPIELTLVHSPELANDYGVLPQISGERIHDFEEIKSHLTRLNQAVPADQCVSMDPIELKIYSPSVPDLTLIDLPGYIQVTTKDQPLYLKSRIAELCERYITQNNILLAVCPADVDLANSEALLASRRVDSKGARTIGVITKLDLVDPMLGASILDNKDYPLQLGYIGVVCNQKDPNDTTNHPVYRNRRLNVGIATLQQTLIQTLERRMASSLHQLNDALQAELEEVRYQYKVEYNDRMITAESYVADSMDILKHRFKDFAATFGKAQIGDQIQATLEQKVLDVCARLYWADPAIIHPGRGSQREVDWHAKLDQAAALLTKCGVGKLSTRLVVDTLMHHMDLISRAEPFVHHEEMRRKIIQFSNGIVKQKLKSTIDQVENTIKPYKFAVDCNSQEWSEARARTIALLRREVAMCDAALSKLKLAVGGAKLRAAVNHLQTEARADQSVHFSPKLLDKAREAAWLRDRRLALRFRLAMAKGRGCRSATNKAMCPEIYLNMVSSKLTTTAVMFIKVELLDEVFFQFPREVDTHLLYYGLTKDQVAEFARQNPKVARQLELKDARTHLEHAASKLAYLIREMDSN